MPIVLARIKEVATNKLAKLIHEMPKMIRATKVNTLINILFPFISIGSLINPELKCISLSDGHSYNASRNEFIIYVTECGGVNFEKKDFFLLKCADFYFLRGRVSE